VHRTTAQRMTSSAGLHLKTFILIFFMILFGPLGNVSLSKGMKTIGAISLHNPADLLSVGVQIFQSPFIWLGVLLLLMFFVSYLLVLSWADYSFVQPAGSIAYAVVALWAHFLLQEPISPMRWAGVCVICLGVLIVGYTSPRTTEQK
jgi:drug/metabolite transporter (DMT)-like permease